MIALGLGANSATFSRMRIAVLSSATNSAFSGAAGSTPARRSLKMVNSSKDFWIRSLPPAMISCVRSMTVCLVSKSATTLEAVSKLATLTSGEVSSSLLLPARILTARLGLYAGLASSTIAATSFVLTASLNALSSSALAAKISGVVVPGSSLKAWKPPRMPPPATPPIMAPANMSAPVTGVPSACPSAKVW